MSYLFIYLLQRLICFLLSHYVMMRSHCKVRLENKFTCVQLHIRKQKHVLTETEINANVANKKQIILEMHTPVKKKDLKLL